MKKPTKFEFKPGPPKPAKEITLNGLKAIIREGDKITGAKNVGGTTYKIFMEGPVNYYIDGNSVVLKFLRLNGVDC